MLPVVEMVTGDFKIKKIPFGPLHHGQHSSLGPTSPEIGGMHEGLH